MKNFLRRYYLDIKLAYKLRQGVIGQDYYKDYLVEKLPQVMLDLIGNKNSKIAVLDIATGHGYTAIVFAKCYKEYIKKIVAYDINPKAVELAKYNAQLNNCDDLIDFRVGSLYDPLKKREKFDLIVSALPPIPITGRGLKKLSKTIRSHHWIESTGGPTGRKLIDKMIEDAPKHLNKRGVIITTHADFLDCNKTLNVMREFGFNASIVGRLKSKKLKETTLTFVRRRAIMNLGYRFSFDKDGDEQFFIGVFLGRKRI